MKTQQTIHNNITKERQFRAALDQHAIVSVTDAKGTITHVNDKFCNISGYSRAELLGENHRILNSGQHDKSFFKSMWQQITAGETWHGNICNKNKNGELYWVESSITPIINEKNQPVEYISIRTDITYIKKSELEALEKDTRQTQQQSVLMMLMKDHSIYDYSISAAFETITQLSVDTLDVNCCAIWLLNDAKDKLICSTSYSTETPLFNQNDTLFKKHNAELYQLLQTKRFIHSDKFKHAITVNPAHKTTNSTNYFTTTTLLTPIWSNGVSIGLVSLIAKTSKRLWFSDENTFAVSISDFISHFLKHSNNKKLAKDLLLSEKKLANAQRISRMGYWIWDIKENTFFWSDVMYEIYGVNKHEFIPSYDKFYDFIHKDDREKVKQFEENIKSGIKEKIIYRITSNDGIKRNLYLRAEIEYGDLNESDKICGSVIDVTEQIELRNQLSQQKNIFESVFNDSQDALIMANIDRKITLVNPAFTALFGYQQHEAVGKTTRFLYTNKDDYDQQGKKRYNAKIAKNQTTDNAIYEMEYTKKDGTVFISNTIGSVLYDSDNKPTGFLGHFRDVTRLKQNEKQTLLAKENAEKSNLSKSRFLSRMSHELRTPLNAILGFSELLKMEQNSFSQTQQTDVTEIITAGKHLLTLINDVLDLSKIESGDLSITFDSINCLSALEECISLVQPLALKHNIRINVANKEIVQNQQLTIKADATRLKQVLLNLLSNAIKYNKVDGTIEIKCVKSNNDTIAISIIDSGIGIAEKNITKLFIPFTRFVADMNTIEGTGIGLSISKNLVELMGGKMSVSSKLGLGSTFCIEFSTADRVASKPTIQTTPITTPKKYATNQNLTVIYIEDNPANLRLVIELLAKLSNVDLITATNAELGLELIYNHRADIILLDINLPRSNGYEICNAIKSNTKTKQIPVVALSANALKEDIKYALDHGFSDYLAKPLDIPYFYQLINQLREQKH